MGSACMAGVEPLLPFSVVGQPVAAVTTVFLGVQHLATANLNSYAIMAGDDLVSQAHLRDCAVCGDSDCSDRALLADRPQIVLAFNGVALHGCA